MVRPTWGVGWVPRSRVTFYLIWNPRHDTLTLYRTIYHDTKTKVPYTPMVATDATYPAPADSGAYEAGLTTVGEFDTVESYCRYFNWLKPPSKLERNSNYHLFKSGIKPMWEDEANANGGKWVLTMKNNPALLDQCWQWLTMALVGEELDEGDEICGAVVSLRSKVDRIQVWTRSKDDVEKVNGIGRKLVKLLDVSEADGIGLEFQVSSRLLHIVVLLDNSLSSPPSRHLSVLKCPSFIFLSTIRRIVRCQTNSYRYRPSLSRHSGPHFTKEALAVQSLVQAKLPDLDLPALGQVGHLRTLGSVAVCSAVVVAAAGAGVRSAVAAVRPRNDSDTYAHLHCS